MVRLWLNLGQEAVSLAAELSFSIQRLVWKIIEHAMLISFGEKVEDRVRVALVEYHLYTSRPLMKQLGHNVVE